MSGVSTVGWDVVNITDLNTINDIISRNEAHPDDFSITDYDAVSGYKFELTGQWGGWQVSNRSDGGYINLRCYIEQGIISYGDNTFKLNSSNSLSYIGVDVFLKGKNLPPDDWVSEGDIVTDATNCFQLCVDADNSVTMTEAVFTNSDISDHHLTINLEKMFRIWFIENMEHIEAVFSVILVNLHAKYDDTQWLYPTAYSYAANSVLDKSVSAFGVLTLVEGNTDIGPLQQSLDVSLINQLKESDANLVLAISRIKVTKNILLQAALALIENSVESDFSFSDSGLSLTNNKDVVWQHFEIEPGKVVAPIIPKYSLHMDIQLEYITLSILGSHFRHDNVATVHFSLVQRFKYKNGINADGEPCLVPDEVGIGDADISCSAVVDDWVNVMEITLSAILVVTSLISLGMMAYKLFQEYMEASVSYDMPSSSSSFRLHTRDVYCSTTEVMTAAERIAFGELSYPTIYNSMQIAMKLTRIISTSALDYFSIIDIMYRDIYIAMPSFHKISDSITGAVLWSESNDITLRSILFNDCIVIRIDLKN